MFGNGPIPPYFNAVNPGNFAGGFRGPMSFGAPSMSGLGSTLGRNTAGIGGLFSKLKGSGISLGGILTNTQKTLNVVNQAIPIIKQTGPMLNNMKTMFKLASAFKDETEPVKKNNNTNTSFEKTEKKQSNEKQANYKYTNEPDFFI